MSSTLSLNTRIAWTAARYVAGRLAGRPFKTLQQAARRSEMLFPGGRVRAVTPFVLPEHLPRIVSARIYGRERVISEDLNRQTFELRPVWAHHLHDVSLLDGSLYASGHRHELRSVDKTSRIGRDLSGPAAEMDTAVLGSTCAGSSWWGHWLEDEVPLQRLATPMGPMVLRRRALYRDEGFYRQLFELPAATELQSAHFAHLLVLDEFAQNPDKTRRYRQLRALAQHGPKGAAKVFLSRGQSGVRRVLSNEQAVCERLVREGFTVVDVTQHSAAQIVALCNGAQLVVSVEGSHMAPLLYLLEDFGLLVILAPPQQVHTTVADIGVFCGLSSALFIAQPSDTGAGDFQADPDELCRFIDLARAQALRQRGALVQLAQEVDALHPTPASGPGLLP